LAQAGFALKSPRGTVVYVDAYLSDAVERKYGFKRIMASPVALETAAADLVISTHEHEDHLDTDAIPVLARNPKTHFAGTATCVQFYKEIGLAPERYFELREGGEYAFADVRLLAVYADHGDLAPGAVGVVLDFDGIRIYHTGDTAFRPERMQAVADLKPDVILACINGANGNMEPEDAARLAHHVGAQLVIPTHFWMFIDHLGNPARFPVACKELAPNVQVRFMTQGEGFIYNKS
jgi:L-ascorbate 6-phosphate lactonase